TTSTCLSIEHLTTSAWMRFVVAKGATTCPPRMLPGDRLLNDVTGRPRKPWTAGQRSRLMSCVRTKDTDIEQAVRSALFARGYRFRKHVEALPGRPDIVFARQMVAVFIDGDFWHGYDV